MPDSNTSRKLSRKPSEDLRSSLTSLQRRLEGELRWDSVSKKLYSTDASVYQELPTAVAFPKSSNDIRVLIEFARQHQVGLIPRTAGTSLAGQVVGSGVVVDVSRHLNRVIEVNPQERWVRVEPGVIRDDLNRRLKTNGLFFGPETSTSNRAMIGGMLGNNSCGSNSIVYGNTGDYVIEVRGFLSDGTEVTFGPTSRDQFRQKRQESTREGQLYRGIYQLLSPPEVQAELDRSFPNPKIGRRNTGYAVDLLVNSEVFREGKPPFNFCRLIAGSEGTLLFATEIKLQLQPLPPPVNALLCAHFESVDDALRANLIAMKYKVFASELIDQRILDGARRNLMQRDRLAFVKGDPGAILVVEVRDDTEDAARRQADEIRAAMQAARLGYAFPILLGSDTSKVWELRKAGLGVVANVVGDEKPVTVIEDTAVAIEDLPDYIAEVKKLLSEKFDKECVYYAHAGSGEIHLRPVLNLKSELGQRQFREIATEVAAIVKKYRGSLSGEHGDGRLRAEFIQQMIGDENYLLLQKVKKLFDPESIFNPGKIVHAPPMDVDLRYRSDRKDIRLDTFLDFSDSGGIRRAAEMCSGSGDCRKTSAAGGTMCPSYMATQNEADSTRGRANLLRHILTTPSDPQQPLNSAELMSVMELCLSCKGCKNECPSNVDIAKMKAEFLQAYYDANGTPRKTLRLAQFAKWVRRASRFPKLANGLMGNHAIGRFLRSLAGVSPKRPMPKLARQSFRDWFGQHAVHANAGRRGRLYFFCDEFTNFIDADVGQAAVEVLERLGWKVEIAQHLESGRAWISQGLLREAREIASANVAKLFQIIGPETPLVSIEPSAILTFRDEYIDLLRGDEKRAAIELAANCWNFEEFVDQQISAGTIGSENFREEERIVRLHGHCYQKALTGLAATVRTLQLPKNYRVRLIPSGCCGMAGSFGYQKEYFNLSMKIGELELFPVVRDEPASSIIAAPGMSCRHQIFDGTEREALHPAQILRDALLDE